ncbi:hydroxyacid dehydrogenase [Rhizobium pusense]|uniref:NAD(P)-dependent oxidoreductase n=1 Tax=Agrobacterium pusense TaxID=648995 RepID=UPI001C6F51CB|nr:NAD(P)-dependent oxidoreductase [Agrobacterium pusense]MBW9076358.1 hydroxyacid dehydrogenase [Agrobacterium pusense]
MIIAHQFPADKAAHFIAASAADIDFVSLWNEPWAVPPEAEALLINPLHPAKAGKFYPKPENWPGKLRWVHLSSTGIDNLPEWILSVELVTTARGAQAEAIGEYVIAHMLAHEKAMPELWVRRFEDYASRTLGMLSGKTLGIIGYGHIGAEVARRANSFDMNVLALRRSREFEEGGSVRPSLLEEILKESDHLLVSAPLTETTRGMIGDVAFSDMKPGVHLINVGRGAIVDTEALRRAMEYGIVARATLDVVYPEPPPEGHWLYRHPGVCLTAHVSSCAPVTDQHQTRILLNNLAAYRDASLSRMHGVLIAGQDY